MPLEVGDAVEVTRNVRWLWRSVVLKTPGVVTAVKGIRYTVAFALADTPGSAVVIRGLKEDDLIRTGPAIPSPAESG